MRDFGIRLFNPQPEPPSPERFLAGRPGDQNQNFYEYKLDNVVVTSYGVG